MISEEMISSKKKRGASLLNYWVYQSFVGNKNSVLHEAQCTFCASGKSPVGANENGPVGKWSGPFPSMAEAQKSIEMLPNAHIKMCRACQPDLPEDEKIPYDGWLDTALDGIRSKFPDAKLQNSTLIFSETTFHELREAFPDLTEKMLTQHSMFDHVIFEHDGKPRSAGMDIKTLLQRHGESPGQKLKDEGEFLNVSSKKRKNKKKPIITDNSPNEAVKTPESVVDPESSETSESAAPVEAAEAKQTDLMQESVDSPVDSPLDSPVDSPADAPMDVPVGSPLGSPADSPATGAATKKGHDDTYYEQYIKEYGMSPQSEDAPLVQEVEAEDMLDDFEDMDALDAEGTANPGLTSMLSKKFSQTFGAGKEPEGEAEPEGRRPNEVRINSDLEKIKTRMKNTRIDTEGFRGMNSTIAELQEKFRRQEKLAAGEPLDDEDYDDDSEDDYPTSAVGSDFDEGIRYKPAVYSSGERGSGEDAPLPADAFAADGIKRADAAAGIRRKYDAPAKRKISFSQIKAKFPSARYEGGRLYIPGADFDDFKEKFPDISLTDLNSSFERVRFGRQGGGRTPVSGSYQTRNLILLGCGILIFILLILGVRALLSKKEDAGAGNTPEITQTAPEAATQEADAKIEGIKAAFPNTITDGGKLYLPDVTPEQFIAKFPEYTDEKAVQEAFPNIQFKFDKVDFDNVKAVLPDATLDGDKLVLPSISKNEFKKYFPQIGTDEEIEAVFPGAEFKSAAVTFEEMVAAFPNATLENGKLTLPDVTFDEFKQKFSQYADVNAMKEDYPEIQFKSPPLSIDSIKAAFPGATLENGSLNVPDATFDEFKAKFPQYSTKELLKVDFPTVKFKGE